MASQLAAQGCGMWSVILGIIDRNETETTAWAPCAGKAA
jgi:hypothetical protein